MQHSLRVVRVPVCVSLSASPSVLSTSADSGSFDCAAMYVRAQHGSRAGHAEPAEFAVGTPSCDSTRESATEMARSGQARTLGWWCLGLVAQLCLHAANAEGPDPENSVSLLDEGVMGEVLGAPHTPVHQQMSRVRDQAVTGVAKFSRFDTVNLGDADVNGNTTNATTGGGANETVADAVEKADQKAGTAVKQIAEEQKKATEQAVARANADEAKEKAKATKQILKKTAQDVKAQKKADQSEAARVGAKKSAKQTNQAAIDSIKAQARMEKLKKVYAEHVEIAYRAKEYSQKVQAGTAEAKEAGAVERSQAAVQDGMTHNLQDQVKERIVKAQTKLDASGKAARDAVKDAVATPQAASTGSNGLSSALAKSSVPAADASGEQAPAAKKALDDAIAAEKGATKGEKMAALQKVVAATAQLKSATDNDKDVAKVKAKELDAKAEKVQNSAALKAKQDQVVAEKEEAAQQEKKVEEKRELNALKEKKVQRKEDQKLEKKLLKAKEEEVANNLKVKLMKTQAAAEKANMVEKEKEAAKSIETNELNLKASQRARELEAKKDQERRESKEKQTAVKREKLKESIEDDKQRIEDLRAKAKQNAENLKAKKEEEAKRLKEVESNADKSGDPDMAKALGISGGALKKQLLDRAQKVKEEVKKEQQKEEKDTREENEKIEDEITQLQEKAAKEKTEAAADAVKLDGEKARDEAELTKEKMEQKKREDEAYKEKLESKDYRASLKQKLITELKEKVYEEVYGPYKKKLEKKLKAELTAEIRSKLAGETQVANTVKAVNEKTAGLQSKLERMTVALEKMSQKGMPGMQPSLGDTSEAPSAVAEVQSLAYSAARIAAEKATARAQQEEMRSAEHADTNSQKEQAFSWSAQNQYWDKLDEQRLKDEAAAQGVKAAVQNQAASAAVETMVDVLNTADGVYKQKKKAESGYYTKTDTSSSPQDYQVDSSWDMKKPQRTYHVDSRGWQLKSMEPAL